MDYSETKVVRSLCIGVNELFLVIFFPDTVITVAASKLGIVFHITLSKISIRLLRVLTELFL